MSKYCPLGKFRLRGLLCGRTELPVKPAMIGNRGKYSTRFEMIGIMKL